MSMTDSAGQGGLFRRLQGMLWRRPAAGGALLLAPPMGWMVIIYLASLAVLLISAFWSVNSFTGDIVHSWSLDNFRTLLTSNTYRVIALRTIGIAAAVTTIDIILAFPMGYFMAKVATPRTRALLFALMLLPLWSAYVGPIYAWRLILAHNGILNWLLMGVGLPRADIGYTNWAVCIVFSYLWLPFMITPVYAALERIPDSYLEASQDLGGHGWRTFRRVVLPLAIPGVIAGSIFTFSLTLGGYITPVLVGGPGSDLIGNVIYANVGAANNIPFAAAFAVVPILVMACYLSIARRLGAFEMM